MGQLGPIALGEIGLGVGQRNVDGRGRGRTSDAE